MSHFASLLKRSLKTNFIPKPITHCLPFAARLSTFLRNWLLCMHQAHMTFLVRLKGAFLLGPELKGLSRFNIGSRSVWSRDRFGVWIRFENLDRFELNSRVWNRFKIGLRFGSKFGSKLVRTRFGSSKSKKGLFIWRFFWRIPGIRLWNGAAWIWKTYRSKFSIRISVLHWLWHGENFGAHGWNFWPQLCLAKPCEDSIFIYFLDARDHKMKMQKQNQTQTWPLGSRCAH